MSASQPSSSSNQSPDAKKLSRSRVIIVVLIAVIVFLGVVLIAQFRGKDTDAQDFTNNDVVSEQSVDGENGNEPIEDFDLATNDPDDPLAYGTPDAEMTMVHWTDPRCPYCSHFAQDTLPELIEQYVDTGKLRIEILPVGFFGDESIEGVAAIHAAGEQDMGLELMEELFSRAPDSGHMDIDRDVLLDAARTIDMPDMDRFESDLDDESFTEKAVSDTSDAHDYGISSVPFFAIKSQSFAGAQPLENFQAFIDEQLDNQ